MAERLKAPQVGGGARDEQVRRDVSEMLLRIERGGEPVILHEGGLSETELRRRLEQARPR